MSIINIKNKTSTILNNNIEQLTEINRITDVNFQTTMYHYFNIGKSYTLIEKTCITQEANYCLLEQFNFFNFSENLIPFIKFIPKLESTNEINIPTTASLTFIPNWYKQENQWSVRIGLYARSLDDEYQDSQLYVTLGMFVKNLSYVQNVYNSKK